MATWLLDDAPQPVLNLRVQVVQLLFAQSTATSMDHLKHTVNTNQVYRKTHSLCVCSTAIFCCARPNQALSRGFSCCWSSVGLRAAMRRSSSTARCSSSTSCWLVRARVASTSCGLTDESCRIYIGVKIRIQFIPDKAGNLPPDGQRGRRCRSLFPSSVRFRQLAVVAVVQNRFWGRCRWCRTPFAACRTRRNGCNRHHQIWMNIASVALNGHHPWRGLGSEPATTVAELCKHKLNQNTHFLDPAGEMDRHVSSADEENPVVWPSSQTFHEETDEVRDTVSSSDSPPNGFRASGYKSQVDDGALEHREVSLCDTAGDGSPDFMAFFMRFLILGGGRGLSATCQRETNLSYI